MASLINTFITNNNSKIFINYEPKNRLATVGEHVILSFGISSDSFLTFQWYNGNCLPIASQNQSSLIFRQVGEEDFGLYRLLIVDCLNNETIFTKWVELKKRPKPISYNVSGGCPCCYHRFSDFNPHHMTSDVPILVKRLKRDYHIESESNITLSAKIVNATTYQWYKNKELLNGYTRDTLIIVNANLEDTGEYTVNAINQYSGITVEDKAYVNVYERYPMKGM